MTSLSLAGKIALITAAGQGIGRASAEAFAAAGAQVWATDINQETLAELDAIEGISTRYMDVLNPESVAEVLAEVGSPDVLFNCAGFVHAGTILDSTEDEWDFAFDLNVKAMYRLCKAVLPGMIAQGGGSIINMSSVLSSVTSTPNRFIYTASKSAVIGLTKSVAADYVTQGVRCNAICPGTVDTPSLHERLRATGDYDAAMKAFIARQPMGRVGKAEEIAALALYLASDASGFTTGQAHVIDGGWAI